MIVIAGHSDGGDGILFVSQAKTEEEALKELDGKTTGTLQAIKIGGYECDILISQGGELNEDGSVPRHGVWVLNCSRINEETDGAKPHGDHTHSPRAL